MEVKKLLKFRREYVVSAKIDWCKSQITLVLEEEKKRNYYVAVI
jgi:hypothetical protein